MTHERHQVTRRELIKRGAALGGAVMWATPVVQTIGISPALAATPSPVALAALDFVDDCARSSGDQLNTTTLEDWNVTAGNVDVLQPGTGNHGIPAGLSTMCFIDLAGNAPATISTKSVFTLGPGTYRLTVEMAGHNRPGLDSLSKSTVVSLGSSSQTVTLAPTDPFSSFSQDVTGPVTAPVVIQQVAGGNAAIGNLFRSLTLEQIS